MSELFKVIKPVKIFKNIYLLFPWEMALVGAESN